MPETPEYVFCLGRRGQLLQFDLSCNKMDFVFLAMGVHTGVIKDMMCSIQLMRCFLQTGWGESEGFIGGNSTRILHGMCQKNGGSLAAWLLLSMVFIGIYKYRGFGGKSRSSITKVILDIIGVVFVDDTNLFILKACL